VPRTLPLAVFFTVDGFLFASWVVRVPQVKAHVHATAGQLGLALFCMSVGGLIAMPAAGRLCARLGTHRVVLVVLPAICLLFVLPTLAPTTLVLGAVLFLLGLWYGTANVALNSAASEIETGTGRAVMPTLHGLWSLGNLAGALLGGLLADHLSPPTHLALAATLALAACVPAALRLSPRGTTVPTPVSTVEDEKAPVARNAALMVLVGFGAVALCTAYGEGAIGDWATLHLKSDLGAGAGLAAYGFAAYSVATTAARLTGSRLIARFGRTTVLVASSLLAAVGVLVASLVATALVGRTSGAWVLAVAFVGLVAVGLGLANVFPIAIGRAGALGGPRGVALAATIGYTGQLAGPPFIGLLADHTGLPWALATIAVLSLASAALGWLLRSSAPVPAPRPDLVPAGD
jgi:MFS family permease